MNKINITEKVNEELTLSSERYNDCTILRALINSIPGIGGPIDIMFSNKGQKFVVNRIEDFVRELQIELSKISFDKLDKTFFDSEEGFDLLLKSFDYVSKTRHRAKIHLFAKVVRNSVLIEKEYKEEDPELFLKLIDELLMKEFEVLYIFNKIKEEYNSYPRPENEPMSGYDDDARWIAFYFPKFSIEDLIPILLRLQKSGLIKEEVGMIVGYSGGLYKVTSFAKSFLKFISDA